MGWTFTWGSSLDTDFNYDFNASFTDEQQREGAFEYNYRLEAAWTERGIGESLTKGGEGPVAEIAAMTGTDVATYTREAGHEHVRAGGRRCLPHLFDICARTGRPLGHVSVARPGAEWA
jgi:predicted dithiol-disulfide oxidoreductase (DUF899 family)